MSHLVNISALGCLLAGGAIFGVRALDEYTKQTQVSTCESSLSGLRQMIKRHAGLGDESLTGRGWPTTIQPEWFEEGAPRNPFLGGTRPWIEIATPDEALLMHPFVRCDTSGKRAEFWYNPYLGIVRARVPYLRTDRETIALYNDINDSELSSLFNAPPISDPATMAIVESGIVPGDGSR
jgi:hypothetical protein